MKRIILVIILIITLMLNGCQSYNDVNMLLFVTSVIVDIDKDNKPVIYVEAFKPARAAESSAEKGQRLLFKGTGKTVFEAVRDIHLSSSLQLNFTQNKIVMYTEKAAKYGIDNFLDVFERGQEFILRPYIAVLLSSPEEFLNSKSKAEEYLGIYLKDLIDNEGQSSRAVKLTLNEYFNRRIIGSRTNVITAIDLKKDQLQDIIEVEGGVVIKDDKMVDFMPRSDGQGYNFLMNNLNMGSLEITNPCDENKFVTLKVLKSKTYTDITYDGKVIHLVKKVKLKTTIQDVQIAFKFDNDNLEKIKIKSEDNIRRACERVFNKYKNENLDIFEIKEEFERKYPKIKIDDALKITELSLDIKENVEGSPDKQGFIK